MGLGAGGVITTLAHTKFLFQITIKSINFSDIMLNDVLKFYFFISMSP